MKRFGVLDNLLLLFSFFKNLLTSNTEDFLKFLQNLMKIRMFQKYKFIIIKYDIKIRNHIVQQFFFILIRNTWFINKLLIGGPKIINLILYTLYN